MKPSALATLLAELGVPAGYGTMPPLPLYAEARNLVDVGPNIVGRMQTLTPVAAAQWAAMQSAAADDGVVLLLVSGFRSFEYQAELIRRKLNVRTAHRRHSPGERSTGLQSASHGPCSGYSDARVQAVAGRIRAYGSLRLVTGQCRAIRFRPFVPARQPGRHCL